VRFDAFRRQPGSRQPIPHGEAVGAIVVHLAIVPLTATACGSVAGGSPVVRVRARVECGW
jgi:hypothetical protein